MLTGTDANGTPVLVLQLSAAGSADPAVRSAFAEAVGDRSYARLSGQVDAVDLDGARPWAAGWQHGVPAAVDDLVGRLPLPSGGGEVSGPSGWAPSPFGPPLGGTSETSFTIEPAVGQGTGFGQPDQPQPGIGQPGQVPPGAGQPAPGMWSPGAPASGIPGAGQVSGPPGPMTGQPGGYAAGPVTGTGPISGPPGPMATGGAMGAGGAMGMPGPVSGPGGYAGGPVSGPGGYAAGPVTGAGAPGVGYGPVSGASGGGWAPAGQGMQGGPAMQGGPGMPGGPGMQGAPGGPGMPGRGDGRNLPAAVIGLLCAALLIAVVAVVAVVVNMGGDDDRDPVANPTPTRERTLPTQESAPTAGATTAAPSATAGASPAGDKPTLRSGTAPRTVAGPSYATGEETYTMAFPGWPFAFRAPKTWGCLKGSWDGDANAMVWVCVDEGNAGNGQKANVMARKCATTCTTAERATMNNEWFDEDDKAKQLTGDDKTWYLETAKNDKGYYTLDMSHYWSKDGTNWQIGVFVQSPPDTKGSVQKIVNEVLSQTS
ncbi:hypothetical protein Val02_59710 [Virgisporangium aliadipatigenens]|uniref:Uncharacterized protein n=1 Tax=Virgisporangium aliadipatigenens TaxID=741659 RepID=A0A8J3YSI9_9ACTN|nr:hypothetical protein Val02_59710 [Virgisporangium aliadipatigenens]